MPISFSRPAKKTWVLVISPIATLFGVAKIEPRFPPPKGRPQHDDVTKALALEAEGRSRPEIYQALGKRHPWDKRLLGDAMRQRKARARRRASEGFAGRDE